eukprot:1020802-Rhodomonas_salina.2
MVVQYRGQAHAVTARCTVLVPEVTSTPGYYLPGTRVPEKVPHVLPVPGYPGMFAYNCTGKTPASASRY